MQISINVVLGTSHLTNTFTLQVQIGKYVATALVDTGSDVSFINAKFAIKTQQPISHVHPVKVVAANGKNMMSNTACVNCSYIIQGHTFTSDFRLLEVHGYDIILGADWILTHSPVGLNLKTREFSITKDGADIVTLGDEPQSNKNIRISTKKLCHLLMKKVVTDVLVLNCGAKQKATTTS
jgi:hypothetical protein